MSLPFDPKMVRGYEVEFRANGRRLGYKLILDDGSCMFLLDDQITSEIEQVLSSLGAPCGARGTPTLGSRPLLESLGRRSTKRLSAVFWRPTDASAPQPFFFASPH